VDLLGNETANAAASEVVSLGGFSSEQPLGGTLCRTSLLYYLIMATPVEQHTG
jgi:hypothetical protein